jgi:hypothetical protein
MARKGRQMIVLMMRVQQVLLGGDGVEGSSLEGEGDIGIQYLPDLLNIG